MPDFNELYRDHNERMEDFWSRRGNAPKYERVIHIFGHPVNFISNHIKILDSAGIAERMYSSSMARDEPAWNVTLIVQDSNRHPGNPPDRLIDLVEYAGSDDWLSIRLDEWGDCYVDMARAEAHAVVSLSLAESPELVSQVLINTILTNFITRHGYSMLHASALVKDGQILLLQAPHGTGKSTTALRLLLSGYKLLSDSMVYIGEQETRLWMGGFPIGRIKLRADMLSLFPGLAAEAKTEPVRNETKHRLELDHLDPLLTCREMVPIGNVEYCLLERWDESRTQLEPLSQEELWPEIMVNSLHYDTPGLWNENLRRIKLLLEHASLHRLRIGTSENDILKTVAQLWSHQK
jgi:hypothetical protein